MVGSTIKVVATAESGNTFESDETEEVALYEALTLISAEQTAADQVTLTTSDEIDADDEITVKKGKKEVKITDTDYTENGAVITLADKIVSGAEYTVTLTPANGDDATSATFEGERAAVGKIEFLNKVLVMKDSAYSEGYAYVKGYDQFGDPISLNGLNVVPGVGKFKSFDVSTGKITIDADVNANETSPFMTIKEVPVFVQYQQGTTVLSAQETLTVSTMGYLDSMEFGEIGKDGTMRDDERLTITELSSKKYYVEIIDPEDQYGNPLTADALNDQKDDNAKTKTLFVIPDNKSGAFYKTGNFAELKGKTILWLEPVNSPKPGTMALTITGAGGKSFTTDITIEDDPYIETINVTYPQLNVNVAASDEFEFSAIDQYGEPVELWDVRPLENDNKADKTKLIFSDTNHMTNRHTEISLSGNAKFNDILYDAGTKSTKVTLTTSVPNSKKGDIISFVTTTAGMVVKTASVTVGGRGTALKIKSDGTSKQLNNKALNDGGSDEYNFNNGVQFEDANGKVMGRDDADYPYYAAAPVANPLTVKVPTNYEPTHFYWTLSSEKVRDDGIATALAKEDGQYRVTDMAADTADVYVVLWGEDDNGVEVLLDQKPFHFTKVNGTEKKFTASCSDTLFVNKPSDSYKDTVSVKVFATTNKGETYEVTADRITLSSLDFPTSKNEITGKSSTLKGSGTSNAVVFVDGTEVATVSVNYTDADPVPTKVDYGYEAKKLGNTGAELSKFGAKVTGTGPELFYTPNAAAVLGGLTPSISIEDGKLTFTDANGYGDALTACIKDQYGQVVTTTTFKANGSAITDGMTFSAATKKYIVDYAAGSITGRFTMYVQDDFTASVVTKASSSADTADKLNVAVAAATGNGKADTITFTGIDELTAAVEIEEGDTLVIASGAAIDTNGKILTINGALTNDGTLTTDGDGQLVIGDTTSDVTVTNNGKISLAGDMTVAAGKTKYDATTFTNNGVIEVTDTGKTITVNGKFVNKGTVAGTTTTNDPDVTGNGTWVNNKGNLLKANTVDMKNANTLENFGTVIAKTINGYVLLGETSSTTADTAFAPKGLIVNANSKVTITEGSKEPVSIDTTKSEAEATFVVKDGGAKGFEVTIIEGAATVDGANAEGADVVRSETFGLGAKEDVKVYLAQEDAGDTPDYLISDVSIDGVSKSVEWEIDEDDNLIIPASVFAGKSVGDQVVISLKLGYTNDSDEDVVASVTITVDVEATALTASIEDADITPSKANSVDLATTTITFTDSENKTKTLTEGVDYTVAYTVVDSKNEGVAATSGETYNLSAGGEFTVTAKFTSDNYTIADVEFTITVAKTTLTADIDNQNVAPSAASSVDLTNFAFTFKDASEEVVDPTSDGTWAVAYTVKDSANQNVTVSSNTCDLSAGGVFTVTAKFTATDYTIADKSFTITVGD